MANINWTIKGDVIDYDIKTRLANQIITILSNSHLTLGQTKELFEYVLDQINTHSTVVFAGFLEELS